MWEKMCVTVFLPLQPRGNVFRRSVGLEVCFDIYTGEQVVITRMRRQGTGVDVVDVDVLPGLTEKTAIPRLAQHFANFFARRILANMDCAYASRGWYVFPFYNTT